MGHSYDILHKIMDQLERSLIMTTKEIMDGSIVLMALFQELVEMLMLAVFLIFMVTIVKIMSMKNWGEVKIHLICHIEQTVKM